MTRFCRSETRWSFASLCRSTLPAGAAFVFVVVALASVAGAQPCVVPDNGSGTVTLPPIGCDYLSPTQVHEIIAGLPPGTTIELAPIHKQFICYESTPGGVCSVVLPPGTCEALGGSLGGNLDCFQSTLDMQLTGTGLLAGWTRAVTLPVACEVQTGPRTPGMPVQTFPNDMFSLYGQIAGDPDFDLLRVTSGTKFGMPSPGHTTLTHLPDGTWNVQSFFDITYRIDFVGTPGGVLGGMSGSTTATIHMQTGNPAAVDKLFISEIVDGDMPGGEPKWIELTNCGDQPVNLGTYRVAIFANGSLTQNPASMVYGAMIGLLAPGASYVIVNPASNPNNGAEFFTVYGFEPDLYHGVANGNGNDNYVLYQQAGTGGDTLIDIYGRIGECQGTNDYTMAWAYMDSYAYRQPGATASPVFDPTQWFIAGNGALDRPTLAQQIQALRDFTTPRVHPCAPCGVSPTGAACSNVPCPVPGKVCEAHCVNFDPQTGVVSVIDCDCRGPNDCHVAWGKSGADKGPRAGPCEVPDNGSGTVTLPPIGCDYLSPSQVHEIIDGLPPGTTIELAPIHQDFICRESAQGVCSLPIPPGMCEIPGGSLGGNGDCFDSNLHLQMTGTGALAGWTKVLDLSVACEVHTGPRTPGMPVQTFQSDMFLLHGELMGDPDFDLLRITGGTGFGLPGPGQTTLTQLPGGTWNVDSFFDITYRIDFIGSTGGPLAGMSGSTTATINMQTGGNPVTPPRCVGGCPTGFACHETITLHADGTFDLCCDCQPACALPGDLTNDGAVDGLDIQPFVTCLINPLGGTNCICGDIDGDNLVTMADIAPFVSLLIP